MAVIWMEPRCSGMARLPESSMWREKGECHETGIGGSFRQASSAAKYFRAQGWVVRDDEWFCPVCAGKED